MKHRITAYFTVLAVVMSSVCAFAGCSSDSKDNSGDSSVSTPSAVTQEQSQSSEQEQVQYQSQSQSQISDGDYPLEEHVELSEDELLADRGGTKPEEGYNKLQNIELVTDEVIGSSVNFGSVDMSQSCGEYGSVAVPSNYGMLVLRNWNTTDLSAYLENGEIVFWVKGESGGEDFSIGLQDCHRDAGRTDDSVRSYKNVSEYCAITTRWQEVRIPLKDYFAQENGLDITCIYTVCTGQTSGNVRIANVQIVSDDTESITPQIKVNQLGYREDADKYAIVSGFYETLSCSTQTQFRLIDADTQTAVYSGHLEFVSAYDDDYSGETVYKADFSDFTTPGTYYITLNTPESQPSVSFDIGGDIYTDLLGKASKYYYYQRANVELTEEFAGEFAREPLYPDDFSQNFLSDVTKTKDVSGGWFDAGDFGKYIDPGVQAVIDLLWAYKAFPDVFTDGLADIPESGNSVPDILDEVKVELDFFLKMQDEDGGFYHRVKPDDDERAIIDSFVNGDGGNVKSTGTTANAVAALSFASVIFAEFDTDYAQILLNSALAGWEYVCENPDITSTGTYGSEETLPQTFLAASYLYYATGEEEYHQYIKDNYTLHQEAAYNNYHFSHGTEMAYIAYLASENTDSEIVEWISSNFEGWKNVMLSNFEDNEWKTALPDWALWWGSSSNAHAVGMEMYLHCKYLGQDTTEAETLMEQTLSFMLGINPQGLSMVTGIGENCIERTFSGIFGEDGIENYPVGYTSGGINMYDGEIISRFPGKCFTDTAVDWVTNENAIYYQSAMIFPIAAQASAE